MKRKNLVRRSVLLLTLFLCLCCFVACDEETMNKVNDTVTKESTETESTETKPAETESNNPCSSGHTEGEWIIDGIKYRKCSVCGEVLSTETVSVKESEGFAYQAYDDGTCVITRIGACTDRDVYIPSQIDGNKVTGIDNEAFYRCSSLTSITIPDSVTSIGDSAFRDCSSLTSVTIGKGVTSISKGAFYDCSSLTNIAIPDSVTSIGISAFYNCTSLTDIYFTGTADEWNAIEKESAEIPTTATIHYNYVPESE